MIELRTPAQIEAMKPAGRFVAEVLSPCATPPTSASTCSTSTGWPTR